jgi:methionine--tRNA ligase beta chain
MHAPQARPEASSASTSTSSPFRAAAVPQKGAAGKAGAKGAPPTAAPPAVASTSSAGLNPPPAKGKAAPAAPAIASRQPTADVSRLDLRVGLITKAAKHPNADSLYIEDINCGEGTPRVVVSGLVHHIPEPEMQQRLVVIVANLKPANLKSVKSHAMVLAATGPDGKVRSSTVA